MSTKKHLFSFSVSKQSKIPYYFSLLITWSRDDKMSYKQGKPEIRISSGGGSIDFGMRLKLKFSKNRAKTAKLQNFKKGKTVIFHQNSHENNFSPLADDQSFQLLQNSVSLLPFLLLLITSTSPENNHFYFQFQKISCLRKNDGRLILSVAQESLSRTKQQPSHLWWWNSDEIVQILSSLQN